ncbi:MAG TPA: hypothetical protein VFA18_25515, partial [Gemmataceae bacterium]|nr:hypothetical protein [Gemmataceae bacterium]
MWPFLSRRTRSPRPAHRARLSFRPRVRGLEDRMLLNAGGLDPTFGAGAGYVTTPLSGTSSDWGKKVLVQPSGNIVVAGPTSVSVTTQTKKGTTTTTYNAFGVVTYNPDGSLDTAFGSGGIVRQLFAGPAAVAFGSAALEPMGTTGDSDILLAGDVPHGTVGMALLRLKPDGSLDTSFGNNGQVITYFQESTSIYEIPAAVAVTGSGQILEVGQITGQNTVLLARYNPNGSLDTSFGNGGTATTVFSNQIGISSLALQPDGKFVVAGTLSSSTGTSSGLLLRYNSNGTLDTTFANGGIVTTAIPLGTSPSTSYLSVAVYPNAGTVNDGKIVATGIVPATASGGQHETEYAAARYNANGSLDTSFAGGAGYETIPDPKFTYPQDDARALAIQPDGKLLIAGDAYGPPNPCYSQVVRLNGDGSLDSTFGNGGFEYTAIGTTTTGGTYSRFWAMAIQPDGKILAAGMAEFGSQNKFTLARYLASEPEIGSLTANANPVTSGSSLTLTASNISDGNAGSTITQVAFY